MPGKTVSELYKGISQVIDALFPKICPVCGDILPTGGGYIHRSCYLKLKPVKEPVCKKCGKPVVNSVHEYCFDCMRTRHTFDMGKSMWLYNKYAQNLIVNYKYGRRQEIAPFLASELEERYLKWIRQLRPDLVIPVPVSPDRMKTRGFNQAGLIAEQLSRASHIPYDEKALIRIRQTKAQKSLRKQDRLKNLSGAFQADKSRLSGVEKVLLIDDIYTTGSTLEICSRQLKAAGVNEVYFITICTGGMG